MKLTKFLQAEANLFAENRLLKFVVVVIGFATVFNTTATFVALNKQRTILVPPVITESFTLSGNKAGDKYLKVMSRYILDLALNYTPISARQKFDELLVLYAPRKFPSAKEELYERAGSIELAKVTSYFDLHRLKVNKKQQRIRAEGLKRMYVDDTKTENKLKTYFIYYKVESGRFMLLRISEKEA